MPFPNLVRSVACRSRPPEEAAKLQGRASEVAAPILTTSLRYTYSLKFEKSLTLRDIDKEQKQRA